MVGSSLPRRIAAAAVVACALAAGLRIGSSTAAPAAIGPQATAPCASILKRLERARNSLNAARGLEPGSMARVKAEREARRGTSDPTYLVDSLGKWEIQDLRAAVKKAQGNRFVVGDFHDRFLGCGRMPIPLMRTAFMDDKSYGVRSASP